MTSQNSWAGRQTGARDRQPDTQGGHTRPTEAGVHPGRPHTASARQTHTVATHAHTAHAHHTPHASGLANSRDRRPARTRGRQALETGAHTTHTTRTHTAHTTHRRAGGHPRQTHTPHTHAHARTHSTHAHTTHRRAGRHPRPAGGRAPGADGHRLPSVAGAKPAGPTRTCVKVSVKTPGLRSVAPSSHLGPAWDAPGETGGGGPWTSLHAPGSSGPSPFRAVEASACHTRGAHPRCFESTSFFDLGSKGTLSFGFPAREF